MCLKNELNSICDHMSCLAFEYVYMKYVNDINAIVSIFYKDLLKKAWSMISRKCPFLKCMVLHGCHTYCILVLISFFSTFYKKCSLWMLKGCLWLWSLICDSQAQGKGSLSSKDSLLMSWYKVY